MAVTWEPAAVGVDVRDSLTVRTIGLDSALDLEPDPLTLDEVPAALSRLAAVGHPALAPLQEHSQQGSRLILVHSVPLAGETLERVLGPVPDLTLAEVQQVALPVAGALDEMHAAGLAHGAVGSGSVILDEVARPVLVGAGSGWTNLARACALDQDRIEFGRWLLSLLREPSPAFAAAAAERPPRSCGQLAEALGSTSGWLGSVTAGRAADRPSDARQRARPATGQRHGDVPVPEAGPPSASDLADASHPEAPWVPWPSLGPHSEPLPRPFEPVPVAMTTSSAGHAPGVSPSMDPQAFGGAGYAPAGHPQGSHSPLAYPPAANADPRSAFAPVASGSPPAGWPAPDPLARVEFSDFGRPGTDSADESGQASRRLIDVVDASWLAGNWRRVAVIAALGVLAAIVAIMLGGVVARASPGAAASNAEVAVAVAAGGGSASSPAAWRWPSRSWGPPT